MPDHTLLAAHVAGDQRAFSELVHRHRDRLWAVALRTTRDPEEAADALQDALISAHRGAAAFRADAQVSTWLHRIVVNACLDRMRKQAVRATVPWPEEDWQAPADPRDRVGERETRMLVHEALLRIPPDQRAAVVAVDVEGFSVADAARALGVAEGTVKSRCARERRKLAVLLGHLREDGSGDAVRPGEVGHDGQGPSPGNQSMPRSVGGRTTASPRAPRREGR
ncbi:MAG: RNA polymerase sigma factor SigM [Mycobacteriaceae bacterium]